MLPHGTGKSLRVLDGQGEKQEGSRRAGADYAGAEEYVKKIQDGWLDIDAIVATPDMMWAKWASWAVCSDPAPSCRTRRAAP